ncbi:MAG: hypothetical protein AAGI88_16730 [Pseudomonadota bacterium]
MALNRYGALLGMSTLLVLAGCGGNPADLTQPPSLASQVPTDWQVVMHRFEEGALISASSPRGDDDTVSDVSSRRLLVFIEGDGRAWLTRSKPSQNPTPRNPLALELALSSATGGPVIYLSRPCQFDAWSWPGCDPNVWTAARYGPQNLTAMSQAIDRLKAADDELILVGYSGGGVMATLLAATRNDVFALLTVAANLDVAAWTRHHKVSPLAESLEPLDYASVLAGQLQVHLVGERDAIVPPEVLGGYLDAVGLEVDGYTISKSDFDHYCCWVDDWDALYARALELIEHQITAVDEIRR